LVAAELAAEPIDHIVQGTVALGVPKHKSVGSIGGHPKIFGHIIGKVFLPVLWNYGLDRPLADVVSTVPLDAVHENILVVPVRKILLDERVGAPEFLAAQLPALRPGISPAPTIVLRYGL
jgi:hypothetical protein